MFCQCLEDNRTNRSQHKTTCSITNVFTTYENALLRDSNNPCKATRKAPRGWRQQLGGLQVSICFEAVRPERQKRGSLKKETKGESLTLQRSF